MVQFEKIVAPFHSQSYPCVLTRVSRALSPLLGDINGVEATKSEGSAGKFAKCLEAAADPCASPALTFVDV